MGILKDVIRESGLLYKQVADLCGLSTGHVSADVSRGRVSAEKAIIYGRALKVDPARLRPDLFKAGEISFSAVSKTPPPPEAAARSRPTPHKRPAAIPAEAAAPPRPVSLSGRSLTLQKVL